MNPRLKILMTDLESWTRSALSPLSSKQLRALAELLGVPVSGTKEELIERLLILSQLRLMLAEYVDEDYHRDAEAMAEKYSRRDLHSMCASAKLWKSGNKKALALCLLSWRNECRRKGKEALAAAQEHLKKQPSQKRLF